MIEVALIVPVRAYREVLSAAIRRVPGFEVVCQAAATADVMQRLSASQPSVVLVDFGSGDALNSISGLRTHAPSTRVVAIGVGSSPEQSAAVIHAAEQGVSGFVDSDQPLSGIIDAVALVAGGQASCSPRIVDLLLQTLQRRAVHPERSLAFHVPTVNEALTPRERLVAELASHGLTNRQIASQLTLGESTIKTHMHSILRKLGLHSRAQLIVVPHAVPASGDGDYTG